MSRAPAIAAVPLCLALATGCGGARDEGDDALSGLVAVHGAVEWRGSLPCADCEGIETHLVLERRDGDRLYALHEVYMAAGDTAQFRESGEWRLDDLLLSLESDAGSRRHYGLVRGGALQVRDPQGRVYPGREHDLLLPAGHP